VNKELIKILAEKAKLDIPSVLSWPLSEEQEKERRKKEEDFNKFPPEYPPQDLEWLSEHRNIKYRPDKILEGCRSVLVFSINYYRKDFFYPNKEKSGSGLISMYAAGRDYHKEFGGRLKKAALLLKEMFPGHNFRAFTDSGPLDETWLAESTGIGFKGRNSLIITEKYGSWVFLGHILSTCTPEHLGVITKEKMSGNNKGKCPSLCSRCRDACPTGAILPDGRVNVAKCISYLTIEYKGIIPAELSEKMGNRIFGCDECQIVCPFNSAAKETDTAAFKKDIAGKYADLAEILQIKNHHDMVEKYAGSPLMRAGRNNLVRNACIAAVNIGRKELLPYLEELTGDSNYSVKEHAKRAVKALTS